MAKFGPPEPFKFDQLTTWPEWKERFLRFRLATKLHKEDGDVEVSSLIYAMGWQAEQVFKSFNPTSAQQAEFDTVITKLDSYFVPKQNIIYQRTKFYQRSQMPGESVEAFLRCLHELAESCDFGEKEEENIPDRIIAGMSDKELSLKLQLKQLSTLTLSKTVEMARMHELVKTQVAPEVSHVTSQKHFSRGKPFKWRQPSRGPTSKDPKNKCPRCGYVHRSSARDACPALNAECRKCGKTGHFQSSPWCEGTVADKQSSQQSYNQSSQQSYNQSRCRANVHEVNVDVDDLSDMTHGMFLGSVTADEQQIYETDSAEIS